MPLFGDFSGDSEMGSDSTIGFFLFRRDRLPGFLFTLVKHLAFTRSYDAVDELRTIINSTAVWLMLRVALELLLGAYAALPAYSFCLVWNNYRLHHLD